MNEWFIWLLFGHLFGDYIFQNSWMALNKKKHLVPLIVHCFLYTFIVSLFVRLGTDIELGFLANSLIFLSHIVLDGTSLVEKWCDFYGIRSWDTHLPKIGKGIQFDAQANVANAITTSFGAIVYVVIDNTLHLFMMFFIVKYMAT